MLCSSTDGWLASVTDGSASGRNLPGPLRRKRAGARAEKKQADSTARYVVKTSNESVRKPAAILKAQRGDRPGARYALQTCRPAPRLRAGAPAYWFGRSPKLVVILLLGLLLLLFFRELRLRLLAGKGWGWKLFVFMMTRRAFLCRGCPQFSSCKQEIAFSCRNFNKKRRALALPKKC